jgi:F0F1-type ATP synthase assembly protein I
VIGDPLQVGFTIVGVTALFGAVGWWLDTRLHTFPICFFLGAVLGLFGIIYSFVLRLREQERASSQKP